MTVRRGLPITIISLLLSAPAWAQGGSGQTLEIGRLRLLAPPAKTSETACLWRDASTGDVVVGPCGTVTSVGLSMPAIFTVSGSPIETSGTLTASLATQTGWSVWRVPDGSTAAPAFGALAKGHLPSVTAYRDDSIIPTTGYAHSIGAVATKYLSGHFAELEVGTLVAVERAATVGGRWLVGPTTTLIADLTDSATSIDVKHNNLKSGDRVQMESAGQYEMVAITSAPTTITGGFRYSVTRNLDGTGANAWVAGDAVFAGAAQAGEGFVSAFADRSALAQGYAGHVVGRLPRHYWRFTSSGTVATPTVGALTLPLTARGLWGSGWATGDEGGSLYRDSTVSSDVAATQTGINATLDGTRSITVAFFLAKGGGSAIPTAATIVRTGATSDATAGWRVDSDFTANTSLRLTVGNGSSRQSLLASSALANDGAWRHYVAVIDREAGALRLYVNGALATSATLTLTGDFTSTGNVLDVLSMDQTNLDELTIWHRALSAADVAALYAARLSVLSTTAAGPTLEGLVRTGSDPGAVGTRWVVGNLLGRCGYTATTYGFVAGDCDATWVSVDATHGFRVMSGAAERLTADTSGTLSLTGDLVMGTAGVFRSGATAFGTGTGLWMDHNAGTPRFRVGNPSGNNLEWNGTNLWIRAGNFTVDTNGIQIEASGGSMAGRSYSFSNVGSGSSVQFGTLTSLGTRITTIESLIGSTGATSFDLKAGEASGTQTRIAIGTNSSSVGFVEIHPAGTGATVAIRNGALVPYTTDVEELGSTSRKWGKVFMAQRTTSDALGPVVSNNGELLVKSNGLNTTTTCAGAQRVSAVTTQYGIVTAITCS
ncbi:MAG: hypothetical protein KJ066_19545 [Acidobacteria bacterium]|nr:hypothetical protein [Acidobacteriota bacterium]